MPHTPEKPAPETEGSNLGMKGMEAFGQQEHRGAPKGGMAGREGIGNSSEEEGGTVDGGITNLNAINS